MKDSQFFIKIDEFKNIYDVLKSVRNKADEARKSLEKVNELKGEEEKLLDNWKQDLDEFERKINFIEGVLFAHE